MSFQKLLEIMAKNIYIICRTCIVIRVKIDGFPIIKSDYFFTYTNIPLHCPISSSDPTKFLYPFRYAMSLILLN